MRTLLILAVTMTVTPEPAASAESISAGPDAAQLARCLHACESGGRTLTNFCTSLPDPKLKRACHAIELLGEVACKGFCYNYWGT